MEKTLSIIKPDGMLRNLQGEIIKMIQDTGLRVVAQKMVKLSLDQAKNFYQEHSERSFFNDLCNYMVSSPVSVQVLAGEDAIERYRELMGATNPLNAKEGTIRKNFGQSIDHNTVHGSDKLESAKREISIFFSELEIFE